MEKKHAVISETVGQYTGLKDKNGTKIFDGDVIITNDYQTYSMYDGRASAVIFSECGFWLEPVEYLENSIRLSNEYAEMDVVGNIHDNVELSKDE